MMCCVTMTIEATACTIVELSWRSYHRGQMQVWMLIVWKQLIYDNQLPRVHRAVSVVVLNVYFRGQSIYSNYVIILESSLSNLWGLTHLSSLLLTGTSRLPN